MCRFWALKRPSGTNIASYLFFLAKLIISTLLFRDHPCIRTEETQEQCELYASYTAKYAVRVRRRRNLSASRSGENCQ